MKLTLLCVGKVRTEYHDPAIAHYIERLKRWVRMDIEVVPASDKDQESSKLIARCGADDVVVLLDENGEGWSTPELAAHVEQWQNQSVRSVVFIIGGSYGVNNELTTRADYVWSLSRLVFPHELVRLLLCEQLYRAYDVLHGGNYHHN